MRTAGMDHASGLGNAVPAIVTPSDADRYGALPSPRIRIARIA
ncbi:MAG: hypothetical protein AVDCRST_MAG18-4781 [uncultured Thermomicrobiales bacterium]|uniref:Uncharacterized protein n=1 Tax=uncultured Thermomicrobiales bacterium TaxID=1645740 RepID=A0A6J4VYC3_9BACT|nr:MAG: hypothetical protein AVDCRST_MAG18-4781 [uncultured Thermomicrobiales bacterium]